MRIMSLIRLITEGSDEFDGKYMKIKFNSGDKLPLNKMVEIPSMVVVVRAVFHENNKYYQQAFSDECLYNLLIMIYYDRIVFLKELILIKQVHQESVMFVNLGIS